MSKESLILDSVYGKFTVTADLPVIDENNKVIGFTNGDGSITITDPEMISLIEKGENVLSFAYKEEKANE